MTASGVVGRTVDVAALGPFVGFAALADRVFDSPTAARGFAVPDPVFEAPAEWLRFDAATPPLGFPAELVDVESAADALPSADASAAAAGLLASATPRPTSTVAAAVRVVSSAGFMESSDRRRPRWFTTRQPRI